ncbi:hypothetical protein HID58_049180, partial [Brassica napus]
SIISFVIISGAAHLHRLHHHFNHLRLQSVIELSVFAICVKNYESLKGDVKKCRYAIRDSLLGLWISKYILSGENRVNSGSISILILRLHQLQHLSKGKPKKRKKLFVAQTHSQGITVSRIVDAEASLLVKTQDEVYQQNIYKDERPALISSK